MGNHEALALFALITVVIALALFVLMLRSEMQSVREELQRVQKGLADLAGVNARTNMYAQKAIAARARQAGTLDDLLAATAEESMHKKG